MRNLDRDGLNREMKRQGITFEQLSHDAGLEMWQLRVVIESDATPVDPAVLARIAHALGVEPDDITLASPTGAQGGRDALVEPAPDPAPEGA